MIIHECIQGTTEWLELRAGIPTASQFDRIVTPKGKASAQAEKYMYSLLAERMMNHPIVEAVSRWMDRGSEMEAEAVSYYELQRDCETVKIGFITNDKGTIGASPDRIVSDTGLLEIKSPSEPIHMMYLMQSGGAYDEYKPQVQGQLWIAEKEWADVLSYHPELPWSLTRIERDEPFIDLLKAAVTAFSNRLEELSIELQDKGWINVQREAAEMWR